MFSATLQYFHSQFFHSLLESECSQLSGPVYGGKERCPGCGLSPEMLQLSRLNNSWTSLLELLLPPEFLLDLCRRCWISSVLGVYIKIHPQTCNGYVTAARWFWCIRRLKDGDIADQKLAPVGPIVGQEGFVKKFGASNVVR
nr:hypothetical protein Iba_chr15aCG9910 [Ipomoea batatas]